MSGEDPPSCGKGLAAHSTLPEALSRTMSAVADVLEGHTASLDVSEENGRVELSAYRTVVDDHRRIAADLDSTARRMAGYRDLPMARHDEYALVAPESLNAFRRLVEAERELAELLSRRLSEDEPMLKEMSAWARGVRQAES